MLNETPSNIVLAIDSDSVMLELYQTVLGEEYVEHISQKNTEYHDKSLEIMDQANEKTRTSFHHLNLTEEQEEHILTIMKSSMNEALALYDSQWKNNQQLASIVDLIELSNRSDDDLEQ